MTQSTRLDGTVLVAGGSGYIGSHTVRAVRAAGARVVVFDDLREGHAAAVPGDVPVVQGDLQDRELLQRTMAEHDVSAVMHFAARAYVGESVTDPGRYWRNNTTGTLSLMEAVVGAGVRRVVFSSTCATYGEPEQVPIPEGHPQRPVNPYGKTKLACEWLLSDFAHAHGVQVVALRYFNAAGAHPDGDLGEHHDPETHLIPLAIAAAAGSGQRLKVFGDDYDTRDGTCVRDYIHVCDLADAHLLALQSMPAEGGGFRAFNLGTEQGTTVKEVLDAVARVVGRAVPHDVVGRRAGDPATLVGDSSLAQRELGWQPRLGTIDAIVETAWRWHESHPHGYSQGG